jgi:hypothetical protein
MSENQTLREQYFPIISKFDAEFLCGKATVFVQKVPSAFMGLCPIPRKESVTP